MNKHAVTLVGMLGLVGCGSGVPWDGDDPEGPQLGFPSAAGGSLVIAGTASGGSGPYLEGGAETGGTPAGGYHGGGFSFGGTGHAGTLTAGGYEAGGASEGGESSAGGEGGAQLGGTGSGGYPSGGTGTAGHGAGGATSGGSGPQDPTCLQNVAHCFEAAANCYEYSPWSDCDQIVDVCAAMQADCAG